MSRKINFELLHLGWDDIQKLSEKLAEKICESGFKPEVIASISRGGFAPSRILCDQLGIKKLASIQIEYYTNVKESIKTPQIVFPLNSDVDGLNVLIVDDVSDSGESLKVARKHILERGASEVKVATLHIKPWTSFLSDYYVDKVDEWIVYPWERMEVMENISVKLKNISPDELKEKLIEIGFSERHVNKFYRGSRKMKSSSS
jgi:hypoxanthine phosphoribosyltransferase